MFLRQLSFCQLHTNKEICVQFKIKANYTNTIYLKRLYYFKISLYAFSCSLEFTK